MNKNELSSKEFFRKTKDGISFHRFELAKNKQFQFIYEDLMSEWNKRETKINKEVNIHVDTDVCPCICLTLFQVLIMALTDLGHSKDYLYEEVTNWSLDE